MLQIQVVFLFRHHNAFPVSKWLVYANHIGNLILRKLFEIRMTVSSFNMEIVFAAVNAREANRHYLPDKLQ